MIDLDSLSSLVTGGYWSNEYCGLYHTTMDMFVWGGYNNARTDLAGAL